MMILFFYFVCFFFFKQKTAYEMRISDWSSDVCSSDLPVIRALLSLSLACLALPAAAQPISAADRGQTIDEIARLLEARYVDADKGRRLATELRRARGQWEAVADGPALASRSEEHTSELQSLMRISYAVFCLKKKNKKYNTRRER